ncbi:hypothetical protein [Mesorhizobium amorphae]|uniref:hypothetical protein n=1 Tax=Mesorhizobium amorphae TaxID=71433 RepID=UPI00177CB182|nr:hypothetical protein [Mesorhizobium amorphae]
MKNGSRREYILPHEHISRRKEPVFCQLLREFNFYIQCLSRACFSSGAEKQQNEMVRNKELLAHLAETVRQHSMIVEAIAARDVVESDRLAIAHQEFAVARLKRRLFKGARSIASTPALKIESVGY